MNIWTLDKDISIKHLLLLLTHQFGDNAFELESISENEKSIRVNKRGDSTLSVYIFTYGQKENHYGVHLEYPDLIETNLSNTLDVYDNINYVSLCGLLQVHLDVNPM